MEMKGFMNFIFVFNFLSLSFGFIQDEISDEDYHVFILGRAYSLSWEGLLLNKYIKDSKPDIENKACAVTSESQCIRKWSDSPEKEDPIFFSTQLYPTAREPIFDRRLTDLRENCTKAPNQLYTVGGATGIKEFTTFFSVRAKCGAYLIIAKRFGQPLYRIKLKDCTTGSTTLVKCGILKSHSPHMTSPCLISLENRTLDFNSLSMFEWSNFKIVKRKDEFLLIYVTRTENRVLYKDSNKWSDFTIQYGHELNHSCWKWPDYEFIASNQNLTVLSRLVRQPKDFCLKFYVLMTKQKALRISVGTIPESTDENRTRTHTPIVSQKIVYNEHPYKWIEVFLRDHERKFPLPSITLEPVPSDPTSFWGLDYLKQCNFNETRYLLLFDYGKNVHLPYPNLHLSHHNTHVYLGDNDMEKCSVDEAISEYCVPFDWVSEEGFYTSAVKKFRNHISYACRCPNDNKSEKPSATRTFVKISSSLGALALIVLVLAVIIARSIASIRKENSEMNSIISEGLDSEPENNEEGTPGGNPEASQEDTRPADDPISAGELRRRFRNYANRLIIWQRATSSQESEGIEMSTMGTTTRSEPQAEQTQTDDFTLSDAEPSTSGMVPDEMVSDVMSGLERGRLRIGSEESLEDSSPSSPSNC